MLDNAHFIYSRISLAKIGMKKKLILLPMLIVIIVCAFGIILSINDSNRLLVSEHHIAFVPDTILQVLGSGKKDVFSLVSPEAGINVWQGSEPYPYPVMWDQTEYLKIADAIHKFIWNEPLSDWSLKTMSFGLPCEDANMGLQSAFFTFSRRKISLSGVAFIEHTVYIYPKRGLIDAWEWFYKGYDDRLSVNLSSLPISARDASGIAEENGGAARHTSGEDICDVSIILSQGLVSNHWDIRYSPSFYKISIDAKTGKIIK